MTAIDFSEYAHLCSEWHSGQSSMMYAVASTGGLSLGRYKPIDVDTDKEWMLRLLSGLLVEIKNCVKICQDNSEYAQDLPNFAEFKIIVENAIDFLEE